MDRRQSRGEKTQEKGKSRKDRKREDAGARQGRKVVKRCVVSMCRGYGGPKSRLAKAAGAETSGEMRDEKLHGVLVQRRF